LIDGIASEAFILEHPFLLRDVSALCDDQGLRSALVATMPTVTPRILQLNFFSFLYSPKFGRYLFFFFLPSLNLDLFQSSSGNRLDFPCKKTLNTLCCLMHHAEPCISFDCFESANAFI
jgi:hypothetical protein